MGRLLSVGASFTVLATLITAVVACLIMILLSADAKAGGASTESGETLMGVSYEIVYIGSSKYIVFKSGSDIEVVRQ